VWLFLHKVVNANKMKFCCVYLVASLILVSGVSACFVIRSQVILPLLCIDGSTGCSAVYWQWTHLLWHHIWHVVSRLAVVSVNYMYIGLVPKTLPLQSIAGKTCLRNDLLFVAWHIHHL